MKKVLLINDSKLQNIVMKDMLDSLNYEVFIAEEHDAISAVLEFRPNYVITNYIMKEINGDKLAALIKLQYPDTKCILSSSNQIDINDFDRRKVDAVILYPIEREDLKKVLNSVSVEGANKNEEVDNYEVKKFCNKCKKFIDLNANSEYSFCPFCGQKI